MGDENPNPWRRKEAFRRETGYSYSKIDRLVRDGRIAKEDIADEGGRIWPHFRLLHQVDASHSGASDALLANALRDALSRIETLEEEHDRLRARIEALEAPRAALALPEGDAPDDAPPADAAPHDASPSWWGRFLRLLMGGG